VDGPRKPRYQFISVDAAQLLGGAMEQNVWDKFEGPSLVIKA
jgi:hypothetical protein